MAPSHSPCAEIVRLWFACVHYWAHSQCAIYCACLAAKRSFLVSREFAASLAATAQDSSLCRAKLAPLNVKQREIVPGGSREIGSCMFSRRKMPLSDRFLTNEEQQHRAPVNMSAITCTSIMLQEIIAAGLEEEGNATNNHHPGVISCAPRICRHACTVRNWYAIRCTLQLVHACRSIAFSGRGILYSAKSWSNSLQEQPP